MKNLKKILTAALSASMLMASLTVYASNSEGTRGGGEIINRHGYKELRDLLDQTTCDWKSGDEIIDAAPDVLNVLKKVSALDWYFAFDLERQIRQLNWCFTGALIKVNTEDRDSLTVSQDYNTTQAAIRMLDSNEVYIDSGIFKDLSARTKAYLVIHETIHSYLDINEPQRNSKLRSMVKSIANVMNGQITTRKSFDLQLSENDIQFPLSTSVLDPFQDYILFVLGSADMRAQILARAKDLGQLFAAESQFANFSQALTAADQASFSGYTLVNAVQEICSSGDANLAQALITNPTIGEEPLLACLSAAGPNPSLRNQIVGLPIFKKIMEQLTASMQAKTFSIQEYRLTVSSSVEMLTATESLAPSVPFISLTPVNAFNWLSLNSRGAAFYNYVRTLIDNGNWAELESNVSKNEGFYQAFSFADLRIQLAMLDTPIPREKATAIQMLDEVPTGYWKTFIQMLSQDTGTENSDRFKASLDLAKLGINL